MNKYRIKFEKTGKIIYIGHLDLLKLFQRSIKRARLGIEYSQGFNPHQRVTFAIPLSLGSASLGEYVDVQLAQPMPTDEIVSRLNAVFPLGLRAVGARQLEEGEKTCASLAAAADYEVKTDRAYEGIEKAAEGIMAMDKLEVKRVVKRKEKVSDIRPLIYSLSAKNEGECAVVCCRIAAGSQGNLKIDTLMECLLKQLGEEYLFYKMRICRLDIFKLADDGRLVSL